MMRRLAVAPLCSLLLLTLHAGCAAKAPATAARPPATAVPATAWPDLRKTLDGNFTATRDDGHVIRVNYKLIAAGSVVLETWGDPGSETITVYHPDGDGLMLTHYCAQGNQARLTAVEATPQRTVFRHLDATDVGPEEGVLRELIVTPTPAGFDQTTTYRGPDGEEGSDTLHFIRAANPAP